MRGVHSLWASLSTAILGSSPHARGPLYQATVTARVTGIIPACAGSTYLVDTLWGYIWDHPRMRGVHFSITHSGAGFEGSSPHARGPRELYLLSIARSGIIPACAGSTQLSQTPRLRFWDHPRMRGVHGGAGSALPFDKGSSPHARGPRWESFECHHLKRIIPACAGSTRPQPPRTASADGSSPHARGPLLEYVTKYTLSGIIPACAGSTFNDVLGLSLIQDHPRMRGVHFRNVC